MLPPVTEAPPIAPSALSKPPTRLEVLIFGLLLIAIIWVVTFSRERTVFVVPSAEVTKGVIT
jgi:hypothetical protein